MIKNFILITFRNFVRNSNYTLINIFGLSVGITSCLLIFLFINNEFSFDKFNRNYNSIYRIVGSSTSASGESFSSATPYPLMGAFRNDFPEIPLTTQLHYQTDVQAKIQDKKFLIDEVVFADSLFFKVFDFEVVSGNPVKALAEPGKFFLTESLAAKMGIEQANPSIRIKLDNTVEGEVAGIIKDPPATSHIQFQMVIPFSSLKPDFIGGIPIDHWGVTASGYSYFVLPASVPKESIENRFPDFLKKYHNQDDSKTRAFHLQPLSNIHFDEVYTGNPSGATRASIKELIVMGILGGFILFIGCINFINLSTALAIKKSKEIGIRKTLGAVRGQLSFYFLLETFVISLIAVLVSLGLVEWFVPWLNSFLGKKLSLDLFSDLKLVLFLAGLLLFTTLLSGLYPAWILSGYNPITVLKNKITTQNSSGGQVRKILVVCQFLIAQLLIISTLIIADQMRYFKNKPLGFNKDAVITFPLPENDEKLLNSLRNRLESNPNIEKISFSFGAPTADNTFSTSYFLSERIDEKYPVVIKPVDIYYRETYGITMKAGRWFTEGEEKMASTALPKENRKYAYILNESAVKRLGFSDAQEIIGKNVTTGVDNITAEVVGVVTDFHETSLHNEINPIILMIYPAFYFEAGLKVNSSAFQETIAYIEKQFNQLFPEYYFQYEFLDQKLEALYRNDQRTFTLMKILSGVSIFVGCLGLYGLISFMANQKLKEVGVRKVMGASVLSIVLLFSKDFIRLILIAFAIAAPVGWYLMNEWLETFAYHVKIHWSVFLISVLSTLFIALLTVSYRSIRAALANPSDTLRTE
jgi:putative ABC transport system permease protein